MSTPLKNVHHAFIAYVDAASRVVNAHQTPRRLLIPEVIRPQSCFPDSNGILGFVTICHLYIVDTIVW